MDLTLGAEHDALRKEVCAFIEGNWPLSGAEANLPVEEQEALFRERAIEAGFLYRMVPKEYGGAGLPTDPMIETILRREFARAGAPGAISNIGPSMLVPTLLEEGTPEQCRRFVPPTIRGKMRWCQGYSEPGSGSDLASLQSRAELVDDEWVINGQKIWTSSAHEAHYMFGLFRTEPDRERHHGISYLLIDMKTPGIDVRPLKQMTGDNEFNEVFFDNVRIPATSMVGKRGEGWKVSKATLKYERNLIGDASMLEASFQDLVELARTTPRNGRPAIEDPVVRQRLAEIEGYVATQVFSGQRQLSASARGKDLTVLGPMMMNKLYSTNVAQKVGMLAFDLLAGDGLAEPTAHEARMTGRPQSAGGWVAKYMFSLGAAIAGGTSNIQRNIIGERVLGLPRDPRPGKR
jgi:alkylation response protein AidB-like acyl-CoA dehydrogenase